LTVALRTILFDLGTAIQQIGRAVPDDPAPLQLIGVYRNLIRRWANA
jgi:PKHD-type hydroxylase